MGWVEFTVVFVAEVLESLLDVGFDFLEGFDGFNPVITVSKEGS